MKTLVLISITLFFFSFSPINYEHMTKTIWKIKENKTYIYLKNDHTFWHYSIENKIIKDSIYICKWNIEGDIMKFSWSPNDLENALFIGGAVVSNSKPKPFSESYKIVSCDDKKMVLKSLTTGHKFKYINNN